MAEYETFSVVFQIKTKKAALLDYGTGEVWTPLSVLSEESRKEVEEAEPEDTLDVEVVKWFAEKELE